MMKTILLLMFAGAALAGSMQWSTRLDQGTVSWTPDHGFSLVEACGMQLAGNPGSPLLPSMPLAFVIDPGALDVEIAVSFSDPVRFDPAFPVIPAGFLRPMGESDFHFDFGPDPLIYLSENAWPVERTTSVRIAGLGGFKVASCFVTPWEYRPLEGSLTLFQRLDVEISWSGSDAGRTFTREQNESAARRLEQLVGNPGDISMNCPPERDPRAGDAVWTAICDSSFIGDFEPLRALREDSLGSASILTIQEIEASFAGADSAERLRNAIRDLWLEHGAVYILLGGDENLIPVRKIHTKCEGYIDYAPSDHYFSDLDGSWDASGDGVYGQPDDDLDLYMDVLLGRALFSSHEDAGVFVDKTIVYETSPPDGGWSTTALLCGAMLFEDIGYTAGKGCDTLAAALPSTWTVVPIYEEPSLLDGSDTHIQYLQDGTGWNYYAGHGNTNGIWWSDPPYTMMSTILAASLTNGDRAGVHTSIACSPGAFHDGNSCAEALLHNPDGGAVSVTFNTSFGWEGYWPEMGPSEWMCILFTRAVFQDHLPTLGEAFASAKDRRVPFIHGPYDRNLQSILAWSAFQDPALTPLGVTPVTPIPPIPMNLGLLWPNPATRGAPVSFDLEYWNGSAELAAWDMAGRLLWSRTVNGPGTYRWDGCLPDGERVPAGIYIISARRGDLVLSRRVAILE